MADILDEAQKKITDAAQSAGDASSPPPSAPPDPSTPPTPSSDQSDQKAAELVDTLISSQPTTNNPQPTPPPEPPQVDIKDVAGAAPKKKRNIGVLIASIMFLLFTIPIGAYYVQLQQSIGDISSKAADGGQCDSGGQPHEYNECCGAGKSRHVVRTCVNGVFRWDAGNCSTDDSQCGSKEEGAKDCPSGQHWYQGACHEIGSCEPSCKGKECGANDGCSGVCTEKCSTKEEANEKSNKGPKEDPDGGIVNKGNKNKDECDNSGNCTPKENQTMQVCSCDALEGSGSYTAVCDKNCTPATGSQSCQKLANEQCKVVQIDVFNDKGKLVDAIVCTPNKSSPACGGTGGDGGTGGGTDELSDDGGGGGKKNKLSCDKLRVYKDGKVIKGNDLTKLKAGDAIVFAVDGTKDKKARIRVNGGAWSETTEKNDKKEFVLNFTLPSGTTKFTVEAEVQGSNGKWK